MRSVMTHQFSRVPTAEIPRSVFDRSHGHKTAFDAGYLIPFYVDEALPGDTFHMSLQAFMRLATPLKPIMDNLFVDVFFFAVPNRLIWDNWEKFNGAQDNPGDSTDFTIPIMTANTAAVGSLSDYMGIPTGVNLSFNSLHHRAYNLIWNEWFRDQNLQDSVVVDKDNGPDAIADYVLKKRGKRHDYFTSCLPFPQKGDDVTLPLGSLAPVIPDPVGSKVPVFTTVGGSSSRTMENTLNNADIFLDQIADATGSMQWQNPNLSADLTNATAATINAIREAFQLQRFYERDARGGTRYIEILKAHFGVTSPDARLQRPEYLGGGSAAINIHPVAQTSATDIGTDVTPQGNLSAFGTGSFKGIGFSKSFTEHCVLIGLVSVRADLTYQQGLNRMFSRQTRPEFYWPAFAHLGEQEVLSKEIFVDASPDDDLVFGYQERFAEYRYKPSVITGIFRSTAAGSLDVWHLSQEFGSRPELDDVFIEEDPPIDRVIAVPSEPHIIFDSFMRLRCARPMPVFSVPGLIDHF